MHHCYHPCIIHLRLTQVKTVGSTYVTLRPQSQLVVQEKSTNISHRLNSQQIFPQSSSSTRTCYFRIERAEQRESRYFNSRKSFT